MKSDSFYCCWLFICIIGFQVNAQELTVIITLDSPGPPHQAGTWIHLTCSAPFSRFSALVRYDWTFYCTHRGSVPVAQSSQLASINDDPTISIHSTPTRCFDTAVCTATDLWTGDTGQATWIAGPVTGIGIWGPQPMASHTAFEADSLGRIGTVHCHSSSNKTNIGHWFSPDGRDITNDILDIFSVELFSGEGHYSYSTIEVLSNREFTASEQGAYTCQAPDNQGILQESILWIFPFISLPRDLGMSFSGRSSESPFTLNCNTVGLPPTFVQWSKSSATLTSGGSYEISQEHSSNYSLNFTNKLVVHQSLHQLEGIYSCFIVSILRKPFVNSFERFEEEQYFGVYSLGTNIRITCGGGSGVLVQWETIGGVVVGNYTELARLVTDDIHHMTFYCRRYNASNLLLVSQVAFKLVVNVPESTLAVETVTSSSNPLVGSRFTLSCRAAINANTHALTRQPVPQVQFQNGSAVQNGTSITVTGPRQLTSIVQEIQILFDNLQTSHANLYLCSAFLSSPALDSALVKEREVQLVLMLPQPSLFLLLSHPPPYYAGSSVTLTCEAVTSPHIDSSITANFTWFKDNTKLSISNRMTITSNQVGQVHRSILVISQLDREQDTGFYHCSVQLRPIEVTQYLTESTVRVSSAVELDIRVQLLQVVLLPSQITALDVSPHNEISITCTASDRDETTVGIKTFSWRKLILDSLSSEELVNGMGAVTITNSNLQASTSSSMVRALESVSGDYEYTCQCIQQSADNTTVIAIGNATSSVRVKGPANPVQVTGISATVLTFSSARIVWTVPSIAYTQETYKVLYRAQHSSQYESSVAVPGTIELNAISRMYSVTLQGLEEGIAYTYRVQSTNTIGRVTESPQHSFMIENSPVITALYALDVSSRPIAGQNFTLVCEAVEQEGTFGIPHIRWFDSNNQSIVTNDQSGIYLSNLDWNSTHIASVLTFQPLSVALSQEYVCQIEFTAANYVKTLRYNLQVDTLTISVEVIASAEIFQAAHPLTLTCRTVSTNPSPIGELTYSWHSDCRGTCFTESQSTGMVHTPALTSQDTGLHSCIVTDSVGNMGNASISLSVTGIGMFSDVAGTLVNNSYIVLRNGILGTLQCLSGAAQTETGYWFAPNGENFTSPGSHPFRVVRENPGTMEITLIPGGRFASNEWLGVYSCRMLNELNTLETFFIGIYLSSPSPVTIESLEASSTSLYTVFTMNCTSTRSVPTSVKWFKDNQLITPGFVHDTVQILRDGVTSTYDNLLLVYSFLVTVLPGIYQCEVSNNITATPSVRVKELRGLSILADPLTSLLGSTVSVTCSSDLGVSNIEWFHENSLVLSTPGSESQLLIHNVSESDHNKEFVCRSTAIFGTEEMTFTLQVEVTGDALMVSITPPTLEPVHGTPFSLVCIVTKNIGLINSPTVEWYTRGNKLSFDNLPDEGSIVVVEEGQTVTSTLSFSSLNHSHSGEYECRAEITTSVPPGLILQTAEWMLIVSVTEAPTPPVRRNPCTMMIQLLLSTVKNCQDYRFVDQLTKVESIISSIVRNINRNGYSTCSVCLPLKESDFTEPTFDCDSSLPTSVLFRVTVSTNGSCDDLRNVLSEWVGSGSAVVTINFNTLRVDSKCPVEVTSANTICNGGAGTVAGSSLAVIGGGAGAGVAVLIICFIILVLIIICCLRKRKQKHRQTHRNDPHYFPRESTSTFNTYEGSFRGKHQALPPIPTFGSKRASGDSYIYMKSIKGEEMVTDFYDDASCKKDLRSSEVYDEIPGQFYEAVYDTPTDSEADVHVGPSVSTFK